MTRLTRFILIAIFFSLLANLLCGCGNKGNLPKTYPCSVEVLKGGTPMDGIMVSLHSNDVDPGLAVSGITNAEGKASISTTRGVYQCSGAPEGNFTIVLSFLNKITEEKSPEELSKMSMEEAIEYGNSQQKKFLELQEKNVIPKNLSAPSKSPLKMDVSASNGGIFSVDLDELDLGDAGEE